MCEGWLGGRVLLSGEYLASLSAFLMLQSYRASRESCSSHQTFIVYEEEVGELQDGETIIRQCALQNGRTESSVAGTSLSSPEGPFAEALRLSQFHSSPRAGQGLDREARGEAW